MDGILQHHKNYHLSSMLDEGPNFVIDRVMGENECKQAGWNILELIIVVHDKKNTR